MKTKSLLLMLVLGLQVAWIAGTSLVQERVLTQGTVIRLATRPVDPRDLLRGDYVILSYPINDVPASLFSPPLNGPLPAGTTVYVRLEPRGEFYEVTGASRQKIPTGNGWVVLKGTSRYAGNLPVQNSVRLEYGIERYYVREGTGNPRGKITVEVAVPASGNAIIKQVLVDGVPYAEAMKKQR
jgi:uncharacterized membrane-anchored protein